jgi:hypothetical protein
MGTTGLRLSSNNRSETKATSTPNRHVEFKRDLLTGKFSNLGFEIGNGNEDLHAAL